MSKSKVKELEDLNALIAKNEAIHTNMRVNKIFDGRIQLVKETCKLYDKREALEKELQK